MSNRMSEMDRQLLHLFLFIALNYICGVNASMKKDGNGLKLQPNDHTIRQLPAKQAQQVGLLLASKNFSLSVQLVQAADSNGTLLYVQTGDQVPLLHFASDGVRRTLMLIAKGFDGEDKVIAGQATLTDGYWHRLILEINSHKVFVVVDCNIITTAPSDDLDFSALIRGTPQFFIAQQPQAKNQLVGTLREFSADRHSYIRQHCPKIDMDQYSTFDEAPPTTPRYHIPQFSDAQTDYLVRDSTIATSNYLIEGTTTISQPIHKELNNLKDKVGFLETQFRHWKDIVTRYESQLKHVQLHQRGCQLNDILLDDGEKWTNETACVECTCSRGSAHCGPIGCAPLPCAHPVMRASLGDESTLDDRCCPVCSLQCHWNGNVYEHGHVFFPKICTRCKCSHGLVHCAHVRPTDCPALRCALYKQHTPADQCCPVCRDHDHCSERPCHLNATCVNQPHGRTCACKPGFFGNGEQCYDIDECKSPPPNIKGCSKGSHCINTMGSFECHCLPGYAQVDKVTCIDLINLRK